MNKKYIIGMIAAAIFIVVAAFALNSKAIEYSNISDAMASGKKVQVTGSWVKEKPSEYNANTNKFSFYMIDKENTEVKVIADGPKPQNFNIANYFVVTGKFENNIFYASNILTKCPSKYEGQIDDLKRQSGEY